MEEENKNSDEFTFSFEISPDFFSNFSTSALIEAYKIQNNILLPSYVKFERLTELQARFAEKVSQNSKKIGENEENEEKNGKNGKNGKNLEKSSFSDFFNKKFNVERLFIDLNSENLELDETKTKSMIVSDLSDSKDPKVFIFMLNKEWEEKKKQEIANKERKKQREELDKLKKQLKSPDLKAFLQRISLWDYPKRTIKSKIQWKKMFRKTPEEKFSSNFLKKFKKNNKMIFD